MWILTVGGGFVCPAPARVTALQADNDHTTHSLTASWERPVGAYDGYSLQLLDEAGALLANRSVPAESRSERFEGLTSGRWYGVKVATLSGGVASPSVAAEGQTRESRRHVYAERSVSDRSITVYVHRFRSGCSRQPDRHLVQHLLARLLLASFTRARRPLPPVALRR